jgi:hypothetical protein
MPKRFLAWVDDDIQLRIEQISEGDWRGYVQLRPLQTIFGTIYSSEQFKSVSEEGVKHGAIATVQNRYPAFAQALQKLQWRELSDLSDEQWRRGLEAWAAERQAPKGE